MISDNVPLGTVASDADTPTFELVRIKLKAGEDVSPNTLVRIPVTRSEPVTLIGRIRSAYEHNPNEAAEAIHLRDTMELEPSYPKEEESTTIFRPHGAGTYQSDPCHPRIRPATEHHWGIVQRTHGRTAGGKKGQVRY
jgi:hypothetical protein